MALIKADGCDLYNGEHPSQRWPIAEAFIFSFNTGGRFGGGRIRMETRFQWVGTSVPEINTYGMGCAINLDVSASFDTEILEFLLGGATQCAVLLNDDGSLELRRGAVVLDSTPAGIMATGAWHWIEMKCTARTGTDGSAEVRLNDTTVLSTTSDNTANTGSDGIDSVRFNSGSRNTDTDNSFDDLVIWDTTGSTNNDFFDDTRIASLHPDSDVSTEFTPSAGGDNYLLVDDQAQDGDTTYVESDVPTERDMYTVDDLGTTPLAINAVQLVSYSKKDDGGAGSISHVVFEGSTTTLNSSQNLLTTYAYYTDIHETNPDTGLEWTESEIDAMNIGIEVG